MNTWTDGGVGVAITWRVMEQNPANLVWPPDSSIRHAADPCRLTSSHCQVANNHLSVLRSWLRVASHPRRLYLCNSVVTRWGRVAFIRRKSDPFAVGGIFHFDQLPGRFLTE